MFRYKIVTLLVIIFSILYVNSQYNLLVYGDTGQFEEFYENIGKTEKDNVLFKLQEDIDFAKGKCTKLDVNYELEGFKNFKNVLNSDFSTLQYGCKADQVVILGDMAYPENGSFKRLTKLSEKYPAFRNRLVCMWYTFRDMMNQASLKTCPVGSKRPLAVKTIDGKIENLVLVTGNHAFDVDVDLEAQLLTKIVTNRATFFDGTFNEMPVNSEREQTANDVMKWPSIQRRESNGVKVEFLDLNMYPIYCYLNTGKDRNKYDTCFHIKNNYGIFPKFDDAETYTKRFIQALSSFSKDSHWRVIRSHNPIFSVEGPFGEQQAFYNNKIDLEGNTMMDLIKKARVNLFLSSHNHFGQVQLFPWEQLPLLKSKFVENSYNIGSTSSFFNFDGTTCTLNSQGLCKQSCYFNDKFFGGYNEDYTCSNKDLKLKVHHDDPSNLMVMLVGFSGRKIDPSQSDQRTASTVVYNRGNWASYGGAYLQFYEKYLTADFFSNGVNEFRLTTESVDKDKDTYKILSAYTQQKISNVLGNNTAAFNYTAFNTTSSSFINSGLFNLFFLVLFYFVFEF